MRSLVYSLTSLQVDANPSHPARPIFLKMKRMHKWSTMERPRSTDDQLYSPLSTQVGCHELDMRNSKHLHTIVIVLFSLCIESICRPNKRALSIDFSDLIFGTTTLALPWDNCAAKSLALESIIIKAINEESELKQLETPKSTRGWCPYSPGKCCWATKGLPGI